MKSGRISHIKTKSRGQAMVEFVIALPILLFVIFGIIEFARMVFAWMAVQNAARFGIRYAVTGEFKEIYCIEAGNLLGGAHVAADMDGGDPQDCKIPDTYINPDPTDPDKEKNIIERELIDLARLFSIQDAAVGGGTGLWLRPNVSGNYEQYLGLHDEAFIGLPGETGFYHITICSNRGGLYRMTPNYSIPLCELIPTLQLMDDAGGPGDRVKVHVEHRHPLFLPILTNIWPSVTLNAERDGIVEKFRTSRSLGVSGPILSAPTWTQTPTITPTPTLTSTPSITPTPTASVTPIPVDCALIDVDYNYIGPDSGSLIVLLRIKNNNPVPIHLHQADLSWEKLPPSRIAWAMKFNGSATTILNDINPPTTWMPSVPIEMVAGGLGDYVAFFQPVAEPVQGVTIVDLEFDDNCHKGISANMPTATASLTPTITETPTVTPTPDCSQYSMSNFSFTNGAVQSLTVTNGDVVDAEVSQIQLDWNYAESFGVANGYPSLYVDWFRWGGGYIHLGGNGDGTFDSSSPTNWGGSEPFNAGSSYTWEIDFDLDWAFGGPLPDVVSNDFGVIIDFDNGCQLRRDAISRPVISYTPTATPTQTWTPTPPPPPTNTPLPTNTSTPSNTPLPTYTPTITYTPSITPSPTTTPSPTATPQPTNTPVTPDTPTPSNTPDLTATAIASSPTPSPTDAPTPTPEPTMCNFDTGCPLTPTP